MMPASAVHGEHGCGDCKQAGHWRCARPSLFPGISSRHRARRYLYPTWQAAKRQASQKAEGLARKKRNRRGPRGEIASPHLPAAPAYAPTAASPSVRPRRHHPLAGDEEEWREALKVGNARAECLLPLSVYRCASDHPHSCWHYPLHHRALRCCSDSGAVAALAAAEKC